MGQRKSTILKYFTGILLIIVLNDFSATGQKSQSISFLPEPPVIDGYISPGEWDASSPATGFIQMEPHKGTSASEPTFVYTGFDSLYLYIAFECKQGEAFPITANIQTRDRVITGDDAVIVVLDTYLDGRSAIGFSVNPLGIQTDYKITDDGRNINYEWDAQWESAATKTGDGWTCEIAIPFRSIKYKAGNLDWGLNLARLYGLSKNTSVRCS